MGDQCVNIAKLVPLSGYESPKDKDILDLSAEDSPAGRAFRERCPDVRILDPVELLRAVSPSQQAP